jgi:TRAP-type mannitol/chloroaromatic compound transport system substrate-binding protein
MGISTAAATLTTVQAPHSLAHSTTFTWRMVTSWPKGLSILQTGAERFAHHVDSMSEGRLKIDVFAGGELINALDVFEAVSQGTVECGHSASYYWAQKVPAAQWFTTVPFGLKAKDLNTWFYSGGGIELWKEVYAPYNILPMPGGNTGIQMGGWFNREIRSEKDYQGLKMRIPGLGGKVVSKLGAEVVLLPAGDIYKALETGQINATEWIGPYHDTQMGFQKIAQYYYAPGWHEPGTAFEVTFNRSAFETLPNDLKEILGAAASDLNNKVLAEFEYNNAMAMLHIAKERKVALRLFPRSVLRTLERRSAEVLEEEADKDPMARKVHDAFKKFKKDMNTFALLRGGEQRI